MNSHEEYYVRGRDSTLLRRAGASARAMADEQRKRQGASAQVLVDPAPERAWLKGAAGEEALGAQLNALKHRGWYVFHDLPIGTRGANVDHLAIGPTGIFSINTKNLSGKIWVASRTLMQNGRKTNYLPKAHREGERVFAALQRHGFAVPVTPVLAILCSQMTIKEAPTDVVVLPAEQTTRWLENQKVILRPNAVFELAKAADDPATWV